MLTIQNITKISKKIVKYFVSLQEVNKNTVEPLASLKLVLKLALNYRVELIKIMLISTKMLLLNIRRILD